jgi:hypothetical protein
VGDEDWPIDNELKTSRAKIYSMIPHDWTFFGPIHHTDKSWTVGVREVTGTRELRGSASSLPQAFRALAAAIDRAELKRDDRSKMN